MRERRDGAGRNHVLRSARRMPPLLLLATLMLSSALLLLLLLLLLRLLLLQLLSTRVYRLPLEKRREPAVPGGKAR
jgi:hypothetical protein